MKWVFSLFIALLCGGFIASTPHHQPVASSEIQEANAITTRYGSMPKGVIVEGVATGFEKITVMQYIPAQNGFKLNDGFYPSPVPRQTLLQIANALQQDDRLGVSIVDNNRVVLYGKIQQQSAVASRLVAADRYIMDLVFGQLNNTQGLPGNFVPKRAATRRIGVICNTLFTDYSFEKIGNTYRRKDVRMRIMLIPMTSQRGADGGYLPAATGQEQIPLEDQENVAHLMRNKDAYLRRTPIAEAAAIGEAAAFFRMMRDRYKVNPGRLASEIAPQTR